MQGCENAYNFSLSATVIFGTFHISQLPEEKNSKSKSNGPQITDGIGPSNWSIQI